MSSTTFQPIEQLAKSAWQSMFVSAALSFVLGVMVLAWPGVTVEIAAVIFGIYLLVSGVMQLAFAFGTHVNGSVRVLAFISGALSIVVGLFCFRSPLQSILLLALWIGIGWIFRGITLVIAAVSDHTMPVRGWQIVIGVFNVLAGIVLIDAPFESTVILAILGGASLIALGVVEAMTAFQLRKATKVPA
jgi:uncharacterized membrane protein HdeD (DUF308 family)